MFEFDAKDQAIRDERLKEWNKKLGPRVGDFVKMLDGSIRRFTYDWSNDMQTTVLREKAHYNASFYFGEGGYTDFSGSLDSAILKDALVLIDETMEGNVWFFHHGEVGAHRGVYTTIPCRVFAQVDSK